MDERHFDEAAEVLRRFLEAREDASRFFQPANQALDDVAPPVRPAVEFHRPDSVGVRLLGRNHRTDAQMQQVFVDPVRTIPFVAAQGHRPRQRLACPVEQAGIGAFKQGLQGSGLVVLSRREVEMQGMPPAVAEDVDFGGKTPAGAA